MATSSLLRDWQADGEPLPPVGERQLLVDSADRGVAVIELVGVEVIRLGDADAALARDEGEGFTGVEEWRAAHEAFWAPHGAGLADDTEVVVERLRVVERLPRG